jgi:hypothetical protein
MFAQVVVVAAVVDDEEDVARPLLKLACNPNSSVVTADTPR